MSTMHHPESPLSSALALFKEAYAQPSFPKLREYWEGQGGINAGLFAPRDGGTPYFLLAALSPKHILKPQSWGKRASVPGALSESDGLANTRAILEADPANPIAKQIASFEIDGHTDFYLPARFEGAHLYAAVGDLILHAIDGYATWLSTQHPGNPSGAYVQDFYDGYQYWFHKDGEFGAVAVRKLLLW